MKGTVRTWWIVHFQGMNIDVKIWDHLDFRYSKKHLIQKGIHIAPVINDLYTKIGNGKPYYTTH